jgi:hypothetical protein
MRSVRKVLIVTLRSELIVIGYSYGFKMVTIHTEPRTIGTADNLFQICNFKKSVGWSKSIGFSFMIR